MLNKSLIKARRPYEDRLEIITLCERLKSFYDKYKGTCESIVPGVETIWFDTPEYQRALVWTLKQKQDYITNLFNGMAEIDLLIGLVIYLLCKRGDITHEL